jgi:hypothetical protein
MELELKNRWVAELRSGNYKQGQTVLRTADNKFCCLGVFCDIVDPVAWREDRWNGQQCVYAHALQPASRSQFLSPETLDKYGMPDILHSMLQHLNDTGHSFVQIAEYIESGDLGDVDRI